MLEDLVSYRDVLLDHLLVPPFGGFFLVFAQIGGCLYDVELY